MKTATLNHDVAVETVIGGYGGFTLKPGTYEILGENSRNFFLKRNDIPCAASRYGFEAVVVAKAHFE